jgi:hypothetical protein
MDTSALVGRQSLTAGANLRQHVGPLGIVGHARGGWPDQQQVRILVLGVLREGAQDSDRVLQPIPARNLADHGRGVGHRPVLLEIGGSVHPGRAPVESLEPSLAEVIARLDPSDRENRPDRLRIEILVLGREGVDRGRDDPNAAWVEAVPHESLTREDVCIGLADVGTQESPSRTGEYARLVHADVAAPDDLDVGRDGVRNESGRLRVVDIHDVSWLNQLGELVGGFEQRGIVDLALGRAQRAAVPD